MDRDADRRRPAGESDFFPVSPLMIFPETQGDFEIYVSIDGLYVLYAKSKERFTEEKKRRLHEDGVTSVYVLKEQRLGYDAYVRRNLGDLLHNQDIPLKERAATLYNASAQAVEHYEITRYGTLGRVPVPFLLRSDNGLVFTSRHYTRLVRSYGLQQEFITPHCPQQNGMVERVIRTLKEQCAHRHRFESQQHAIRVIGDWIQFYNHRRPHQALGMKTPAEAYALAA